MVRRRVFYSFHYMPDNSRASQVRNIGVVEGNRPATDNDWEEVVGAGDAAIKRWINGQLEGRTCTVVLVGSQTAGRKWITHEIMESWNKGMGVVGIYIHGLKDLNQRISKKGNNPFDYIDYDGKKLSQIVKCYNPQGTSSKAKYASIKSNLARVIEEAIEIRKNN